MIGVFEGRQIARGLGHVEHLLGVLIADLAAVPVGEEHLEQRLGALHVAEVAKHQTEHQTGPIGVWLGGGDGLELAAGFFVSAGGAVDLGQGYPGRRRHLGVSRLAQRLGSFFGRGEVAELHVETREQQLGRRAIAAANFVQIGAGALVVALNEFALAGGEAGLGATGE